MAPNKRAPEAQPRGPRAGSGVGAGARAPKVKVCLAMDERTLDKINKVREARGLVTLASTIRYLISEALSREEVDP